MGGFGRVVYEYNERVGRSSWWDDIEGDQAGEWVGVSCWAGR